MSASLPLYIGFSLFCLISPGRVELGWGQHASCSVNVLVAEMFLYIPADAWLGLAD